MRGSYFDHNATTPLDPEVREAMLPWLGGAGGSDGLWGNPSSVHRFGQAAREAVEAAREQVAGLIGCRTPEEIVFVSSGTEANNAVVASRLGECAPGDRFVVSALEHPSILVAARAGAPRAGVVVEEVPPQEDGVVSPDRMVAAAAPGTRLAALMLANNELGTLQPVPELAAALRERGVPVLCDAVQAVGKIPVSVQALGVDYLTLAAHKFHGPLGAAALWIRGGAAFSPLLVGGAQERQRRASTVNVPAVVGFGKACALAARDLPARHARLRLLRDRFEAGLTALPEARVHCAGAPRLPHTSHVAFPGLVGQELMIRLDLMGLAVSTGAACGSGTVRASSTLLAMGMAHDEAIASLRVSFGLSNTVDEVDVLLQALAEAVAVLRSAAVAR
ncbi:MAG: cysteine desulfurase [Thermoanaerobaculia bacterium]|nr:cysteine desulfurase [Thermoanaerobaculia bacterium]MBP9823575.1 cysteine desulfurase [Thermoanaerobaculia bacterium]